MTTLPMQYFGHGSARIIMPRALTRHTRKEWKVSPLLIILLLSLTLFVLHQLTLDRLSKLKYPRTIIIMPQAPPLPEPTIEKKLPPLRVVTDTKKKAPKPIPKEPPPPPLAQPKKIIIREMTRPKPKSLAPLVPKPMKALAVHKKRVPQKTRPLKSKMLTPQLKATLPLPSATHTERVTHTKKRRALSLKTTPKAIAPPSTPQKITTTPVTRALKRLQPVEVTTHTLLHERRPPTSTAPLSVASKRDFSPLLSPDAIPLVAKKSRPRPLTMVSVSPKKGPPPRLTQWSAPGTMAPAPRANTPPRALKPRLIPVSSSLSSPHLSGNDRGTTMDIDDRVHIQGSTLGHSLRVQNLKEEIYKKTRFMAAAQSPYIYQIRHYRCGVILSDTEPPMITLTFEPSDAPFDVVSALERILPRRRPYP